MATEFGVLAAAVEAGGDQPGHLSGREATGRDVGEQGPSIAIEGQLLGVVVAEADDAAERLKNHGSARAISTEQGAGVRYGIHPKP